MNKGYFITGTDTNVGKTWATIALLHYFRQQGQTVICMKPVASGCAPSDGQLKNADALLLQNHSSVMLPYELINPYAYALPVSPHLAGLDNPVDFNKVLSTFKHLQTQADIVLVEGAGGWLTPVTSHQDISDLAKLLALPVILVVAIRLGCINHAKLSHQAIVQSGVTCAGWIAVCLEPEMLLMDDNIATLKAALPHPLRGILPYFNAEDFNNLASYLDNMDDL